MKSARSLFTTSIVLSFVFTYLVGFQVAAVLPPQDTSPLCLSKENILSFSKSPMPSQSTSLKIVTWNLHKLDDQKIYDDLNELSQSTDLFFLQEALHTMGLQSWFENKPYNWNFFKSFCLGLKATGVMTGARSTFVSSDLLASPTTEPVTNTHKVTGFNTIEFQQQKIILVNTHALNFNAGSGFKNQIDQIIAAIQKAPQIPLIWAGDFNTWNPERTKYLLQQAQTVGLTHLTFNNDNRKLKLDHIFVRGFKILSAEALHQYKSSDHIPLSAELAL